MDRLRSACGLLPFQNLETATNGPAHDVGFQPYLRPQEHELFVK